MAYLDGSSYDLIYDFIEDGVLQCEEKGVFKEGEIDDAEKERMAKNLQRIINKTNTRLLV